MELETGFEPATSFRYRFTKPVPSATRALQHMSETTNAHQVHAARVEHALVTIRSVRMDGSVRYFTVVLILGDVD